MRGMGKHQGPNLLSSPNLGPSPAGGGEQLSTLIPSLASLRSENSWAPGDKDQSLRGVCVQEKGKRMQQLLSWGKEGCPPPPQPPPSDTHTYHKVVDQTSLKKPKKRKEDANRGVPFFPVLLLLLLGGGCIVTPSEQCNYCNVACNNSYSWTNHSY